MCMGAGWMEMFYICNVSFFFLPFPGQVVFDNFHAIEAIPQSFEIRNTALVLLNLIIRHSCMLPCFAITMKIVVFQET